MHRLVYEAPACSFRCSPNKTVSRFGSSQRSGTLPYAWLATDKNRSQSTPQKARPSHISQSQQRPHSLTFSPLCGSTKQQQVSAHSKPEQQQHEAGIHSPGSSGKHKQGREAASSSAAEGREAGRHVTGSLLNDDAEEKDYLDIPRRLTGQRAGSAHRSRHCTVRRSSHASTGPFKALQPNEPQLAPCPRL